MADATAPRAFHIMARPTGAVCNLVCDYCFFLAKERLHPGSRSRMSEEVLEAHVRQVPEAHQVPQVTVACQGGEPTLMGLDFFRRAQEYIENYRKPKSPPSRGMACCWTTSNANSCTSITISSESAWTGRERCTTPTGRTRPASPSSTA